MRNLWPNPRALNGAMAALCLSTLLPAARLHANPAPQSKFSDCVAKETGLIQSIKSAPGAMASDPKFTHGLDTTSTLLASVQKELKSSSNPDLSVACGVSDQPSDPINDLQSIVEANKKATDTLNRSATPADKKKNEKALKALADGNTQLQSLEQEITQQIANSLARATTLLASIAKHPKAATDLPKPPFGGSAQDELKKAVDLLTRSSSAWTTSHAGLTPVSPEKCDAKAELQACFNRESGLIADSLTLLPKPAGAKTCAAASAPVQCDVDKVKTILAGIAPQESAQPDPSAQNQPPGDDGAPAKGRMRAFYAEVKPYLLTASVSLNALLLAAFIAVWLFPLRSATALQRVHRDTLVALKQEVKNLDNSRTALEDKLMAIEKEIKAAGNRKVPASDPPFDPYSAPVSREPLSKLPRDRVSQSTGPLGRDDEGAHVEIENNAALNIGSRTTAPISVNIGIDSNASAPKTERPSRSIAAPSNPEDDYNRARTMRLEEGEAWFFALYPNHQSLACSNLEQYRNPHIALEFEPSSRGTFLLVQASGMLQYYVFPQLKDDLASARRGLEGVFKFPDSSATSLRVTRAARVTQSFSVTGGFQLKPDGQGVIDPA